MSKKKNIKRKNKIVKILPFIIFFVIILMSVGYATINSEDLEIIGTTVAQVGEGVVITQTKYKTNKNALVDESLMQVTTDSVLKSVIVLSPTDSSSTLTYEITIHNLLELNQKFIGTTYDSAFYDNENITFEISDNLSYGTIIKSGQSITFDITFKYKDGVTPSSITNKLNSYINFNFGFAPTTIQEFDHTGASQVFEVPYTGKYKIELWGAQGGSYDIYNGGYGAYVTGEVELTEGQTLYAFVGGTGSHTNTHGATAIGGFNGGGNAVGYWSSSNSNNEHKSSGGGATHLSYINEFIYETTDINNILAIAAGGAGQIGFNTGTPNTDNYKYAFCSGGSGGGFEGGVGICDSNMISLDRDIYTLANQTTPGSTKYASNITYYGAYGKGGAGYAGGGGGYYGGAGGYNHANGGSSYIANEILTNKYMICNSCAESSEENLKTTSVNTHSDAALTDTPKEGNGYIKITLIEQEIEPEIVGNYYYKGEPQIFKVPQTGIYRVELWGGTPNNNYNAYTKAHPAYGGYVKGEIELEANTELYVYVGGRRQNFNGSAFTGKTGSGGATDIRLVGGEWNDFESLKSRIIVAGGAGGPYGDASAPGGGHAGGLLSTAVSHNYHPISSAGQTYGGKAAAGGTVGLFGIGGTNSNSYYNPGGGGYFGGGGGPGGGGGSSFISGHNGCVAILENSTQDNILQKADSTGVTCTDGTTDITCSYHYSGYVFNNTVMIDGGGYVWTTEKAATSTGMPTFDGLNTMTGNDGEGYAKITLIRLK